MNASPNWELIESLPLLRGRLSGSDLTLLLHLVACPLAGRRQFPAAALQRSLFPEAEPAQAARLLRRLVRRYNEAAQDCGIDCRIRLQHRKRATAATRLPRPADRPASRAPADGMNALVTALREAQATDSAKNFSGSSVLGADGAFPLPRDT